VPLSMPSNGPLIGWPAGTPVSCNQIKEASVRNVPRTNCAALVEHRLAEAQEMEAAAALQSTASEIHLVP